MRFFKEYVIIAVIVVIILLTDYWTDKNLSDATRFLKDSMIEIEQKVKDENMNEAQDEFFNVKEEWKSRGEKLALFVEHNELEKVNKNVELLVANFESGDKDELLENVADLKFILEHIEEKNQLKLKNIF